MQKDSTLMQIENGLQFIVHHNENLSTVVTKKIKSL